MGNCCGKSAIAVSPLGNGAGTSLKGHAGSGMHGRSGQHGSLGTPNLFRVLGLDGLDADGDVEKMRVS